MNKNCGKLTTNMNNSSDNTESSNWKIKYMKTNSSRWRPMSKKKKRD